MRYKSGTCKDCGDVKVEQTTPNHLLHLILSLFTVGLWAIIWLLAILRPRSWRCSQCGRRAKAKWFG